MVIFVLNCFFLGMCTTCPIVYVLLSSFLKCLHISLLLSKLKSSYDFGMKEYIQKNIQNSIMECIFISDNC